MSQPDHILFTEDLQPHFGDDCFIGPSIASDHLPLLIHTTLCNTPAISSIFNKEIQDWRNANLEAMSVHLQNHLHITALTNPNLIDSHVNSLTSELQNVANTHIPKKQIIINRPPPPQPHRRPHKNEKKNQTPLPSHQQPHNPHRIQQDSSPHQKRNYQTP